MVVITTGTTSKQEQEVRTTRKHTQLVTNHNGSSSIFDALFAPTGPVQNDLHFLLLERLASSSALIAERKTGKDNILPFK